MSGLGYCHAAEEQEVAPPTQPLTAGTIAEAIAAAIAAANPETSEETSCETTAETAAVTIAVKNPRANDDPPEPFLLYEASAFAADRTEPTDRGGWRGRWARVESPLFVALSLCLGALFALILLRLLIDRPHLT
jgi:hypothetical protein